MPALLDRGLALAGRALVAAADGVRAGPRLTLLIFHRVHASTDPLFEFEATAERFDRMMAMVARGFRVLPLEQAVAALANGSLPPRALSITFDDGYADNHDVALPILEKHGLTATFFVATGFLDGGRMWNDTVIECVRRSRRPAIDLSMLGLPTLALGGPAARRAVIDRVLPLVKYRPLAEREALLRDIHAACGSPDLPNDLMMTSAQVRALADAGMTIGAHTVNHPILRTLDDVAALEEIDRSRRDLERLTGRPVTTFAYPNGKPGVDYDDRHVDMVRRLGFVATASTVVGVARRGDDLHQLRRFSPWHASPPRWFASLMLQRARG